MATHDCTEEITKTHEKHKDCETQIDKLRKEIQDLRRIVGDLERQKEIYNIQSLEFKRAIANAIPTTANRNRIKNGIDQII